MGDALRLAGGAAGVQQIEEILGVHRLGRTRDGIVALVPHQVLQADVAALGPRHVRPGARGHHDVLHGRRPLQGLVGVPLEGHALAAPPPLVLGDQHLAPHVVQPIGQGLGGEPAEDHGVGRSQPRAGQHGHGERGDHPHVDPDGGALADPDRAEPVGQTDHLVPETSVGDRLGVALRLTLPVVGHPVPEAGSDVAVDAVVGDVELPALKPPYPGRVPGQDPAPRLEPVQLLRLPGPEPLEVGGGLSVDVLGLDHGVLTERRGRLDDPALLEQRGDVLRLGAHSNPPGR
jgi:hypothetical protein